MTACTVCGGATCGRDDDNDACCLACLTANFAGAECEAGARRRLGRTPAPDGLRALIQRMAGSPARGAEETHDAD